jgi:hypothetical protein
MDRQANSHQTALDCLGLFNSTWPNRNEFELWSGDDSSNRAKT